MSIHAAGVRASAPWNTLHSLDLEAAKIRRNTLSCFRIEGLGFRARGCRRFFLCTRQHSLRVTAATGIVRSCNSCRQACRQSSHLQVFPATVAALSQVSILSEMPKLEPGIPNHPAFLPSKIKFKTPKPVSIQTIPCMMTFTTPKPYFHSAVLKGSSSRLDPAWRSTSAGRGFQLVKRIHSWVDGVHWICSVANFLFPYLM